MSILQFPKKDPRLPLELAVRSMLGSLYPSELHTRLEPHTDGVPNLPGAVSFELYRSKGPFSDTIYDGTVSDNGRSIELSLGAIHTSFVPKAIKAFSELAHERDRHLLVSPEYGPRGVPVLWTLKNTPITERRSDSTSWYIQPSKPFLAEPSSNPFSEDRLRGYLKRHFGSEAFILPRMKIENLTWRPVSSLNVDGEHYDLDLVLCKITNRCFDPEPFSLTIEYRFPQIVNPDRLSYLSRSAPHETFLIAGLRNDSAYTLDQVRPFVESLADRIKGKQPRFRRPLITMFSEESPKPYTPRTEATQF